MTDTSAIQIQMLNDYIAALERQVKSGKTERDSLFQQIAKFDQLKSKQDEELRVLKNQIRDLDKMVYNQSVDRINMEKDINFLASANQSLKKQIQFNKNKLVQMNLAIAEKNDLLAKQKQNLHLTTMYNNKVFGQLEQKCKELEKKLEQSSGQTNVLSKKITELEKEIGKQRQVNMENTAKMYLKDKQINAYEGKVKILEIEILKVTQKKQLLKGRVAEVQTRLQNSVTQCRQLQQKVLFEKKCHQQQKKAQKELVQSIKLKYEHQISSQLTLISTKDQSIKNLNEIIDTQSLRISNLTKIMVSKDEQISKISGYLKQKENENKKQKQKINGQNETIEELMGQIKSLKSSNQESIKKIQELNDLVAKRQAQIKSLNKEIRDLIDIKEMTLSDKQVQFNKLRHKLSSIEQLYREKSIESQGLAKEVQNLKNEVITKSQEIQGKTNKLEILAKQVQVKTLENQRLANDLKSKENEIQARGNEIQTLKLALESKENDLQLKTIELKSKENQIELKSNELIAMTNELDTNKIALQVASHQLEIKTSQCQTLQFKVNCLSTQLEHYQKGMQNLGEQKYEQSQKLKNKIEVLDTQLIDFRKRQAKLTKSHKQTQDKLLKLTQEFSAYKVSTQKTQSQQRKKIQELEKQLQLTKILLSQKQLNLQGLGHQNQFKIKLLTNQQQSVIKQLTDLQAKYTKVKNKLAQAEKQLDLKDILHNIKIQKLIIQHKNQLKVFKKHSEEQLSSQQAKYEDEIASSKKLLKTKQKQLQETSNELQDLKLKMNSKMISHLTELEKKISILQIELQSTKNQLSMSNQNILTHQSTIKKLKDQNSDLNKRIQGFNLQLQKTKTQNAWLIDENEALRTQMQALESSTVYLKKQIASSLQQQQKSMKQIRSLKQTNREMSKLVGGNGVPAKRGRQRAESVINIMNNQSRFVGGESKMVRRSEFVPQEMEQQVLQKKGAPNDSSNSNSKRSIKVVPKYSTQSSVPSSENASQMVNSITIKQSKEVQQKDFLQKEQKGLPKGEVGEIDSFYEESEFIPPKIESSSYYSNNENNENNENENNESNSVGMNE